MPVLAVVLVVLVEARVRGSWPGGRPRDVSTSSDTSARPASLRPRTTARRPSLSLTAALAAAGLLLAGCGSDDGGGGGTSSAPAPTATSEAASPEPTTSAPEPSGSAEPPPSAPADPGVGAGCPATDGGIPEGAATSEVVDVDGDGRADTAWLTGGADRTLGITTASGATFSAPVESASPIGAAAVVDLVGADRTPVALVDLGREAQLFSLDGCAVTQTVDDGGQPYTFDRGFGDQGTGVGCTDVDGVLHLAGLLATDEGDGWTVTRTLVDLDPSGEVATNGAVEVVAEGAAATDPVVTTAQEVSCGDLVAGDGGLAEPTA